LILAALAATLLVPAAVRADVRPDPSPLALPSAAVSDMITRLVPFAGEPASPETPVTLALAQLPAPAHVDFSGVHYVPRGHGYRHHPESSGVSQLHAGFFDPDGTQTPRFDLGIRGGPMIDENLQLGLGVDWIHKSENVSNVTRTTNGPGGVPIDVKQKIAQASVNMFPVMGFVQISAPSDLGIVPYFGGGGGYQVLVLSGDDFTSGQSFQGTFGGWGWQAWGGVGIPMGGRTRLTGEVYVNGAELSRDVTDDATNQKVHETVNGDGMGARFGVAWGF
jgi:hypothetical protein